MSYEKCSYIGTLSRDEVQQFRRNVKTIADLAILAGVTPDAMRRAMHDWQLVGQRGGDRRSCQWSGRHVATIGGAA